MSNEVILEKFSKIIQFAPFLLLILAQITLLACTKQENITIPGNCGLVMGSVFNQIETEEDCRVQCRNECFAREKQLSDYKLIKAEDTACNSCECSCR